MTVVSRLYGWGRLGSEIRGRLSTVIGQLVALGAVSADPMGFSLHRSSTP